MKIEDVEVGMEVKLVSTLSTETYLGYSADMLSVGECSEVVYVDNDCSVKLSDNYWYCVSDLKPYTESRQNTKIGNLTVSISSEDKEEIAKDVLKIVLKDFNKVISDAIAQLDDDSEYGAVEIKQTENVLSQFTDQKFFDMLPEQALKEVFKETFLNSLNKRY